MKILVCGGRKFCDAAIAFDFLNRANAYFNRTLGEGITLIIHGAAQGADSLAGQWADANGIHSAAVKALWKLPDGTTDKRAGIKRNLAMLQLRPDGVIAFPGGRGTAHMSRAAMAAGVPVYVVKINSTRGS